MKHKIIKKFPNSPKVGTILESCFNKKEYVTLVPAKCIYFNKEEVESNPEYFAPYLGLSNDGQDYYKGDKVYWIDNTKALRGGNIQRVLDYPIFVNKEKAQEYINSLKPKFKKDEWLWFENSDFYGIMRYECQFDKDFSIAKEQYYINKESGAIFDFGTGHYHKDWIEKATPEQIQEILSKVAIYKGFKEGVKYRNALSGDITKFDKDGKFFYNSLDGLGCKYSGWIYYQGKWAEIVDDIPEYVECIKIPEKWWNWNEMYVGRVFKTCEDAVPGDRYRLLLESGGGQPIDKYTEQYFKPSSKGEYELQQFKNNSKQVIVTVDGQVTSVSSYGSEVKINYITK